MREVDPRLTIRAIACAIIQRAVEDAKLMIRRGIIVRGRANRTHKVFREKKQYNTDGWSSLRHVNPRDVYDLLRFFNGGIVPVLKLAGVKVDYKKIKKKVLGI